MSLTTNDYNVACICPMGVELAPVKAMLDEIHPGISIKGSRNSYTLGKLKGHNLVIAVLPEIGANSAATVAAYLLKDFPSVKFGLLVGIGGGVPNLEEGDNDIRLGDVAISKSVGDLGGVVQYDLGKYSTGGGFERTGVLAKPPSLLQASVEKLAADHRIKGSSVPEYLAEMLKKYPRMADEYLCPGVHHDQLFKKEYPHRGGATCHDCDQRQVFERKYTRQNNHPKYHYGIIGSGNLVVKDAELREELRQELKVICVEMEAASLMDSFPCLVIRGICDYADSHKTKTWQPYAAATAAAYMKELLSVMTPEKVANVSPATALAVVQTSQGYHRGLNLFNIPDLSNDLFVGRNNELGQMESRLFPNSSVQERKLLVLGGMGGIGKTQTAIQYAKRHRTSYSSVFWLNATSESTLNISLRTIAMRILPINLVNNAIDDQALRFQVSNWFSELENTNWLLIFDNYDDPDEYNIENYYPDASHGSILVTTRLPERLNGLKIVIRPMENLQDGLRILATRSDRENVLSDTDARHLVERLDGFPLALATAGSFLKKSAMTFSQYLKLYNTQWNISGQRSRPLPDYLGRTLYTTWNISFSQLEREDAESACLLKLLAYFDNQNIWLELFDVDTDDDKPDWFIKITQNAAYFESVVSVLVDYCFVECRLETRSYSLHVCVHDWLLDGLNKVLDERYYATAFNCVADAIPEVDHSNWSLSKYRGIALHALRLGHGRLQTMLCSPNFTVTDLMKLAKIAELLRAQTYFEAAEVMFLQSLTEMEKTIGLDNEVALATANNLALNYDEQSKMVEAETMLIQVLGRKERILGPEHPMTLASFANLGVIKYDQGMLLEAETTLKQVLEKYKNSHQTDNIKFYELMHNLGLIYRHLGKLAEAENLGTKALVKYQQLLGNDHPLTISASQRMGSVYGETGKLIQAEEILTHALVRYEKTMGPDHPYTLNSANELAIFYINQGLLLKAEELFTRAVDGYENSLGHNHSTTLQTLSSLGSLYCEQNKLCEAESTISQALAGQEENLWTDHHATLLSVVRLGNVYFQQGRLGDAELMYQRALTRFEHALGKTQMPTLCTLNNLANVYSQRHLLEKAQEMYQRALSGLEKILGLNHRYVFGVINNIAVLFFRRGLIAESKEMCQRAIDGLAVTHGLNHPITRIAVQNLRRIEAVEHDQVQDDDESDVSGPRGRRLWYW